MDFSKRWGYYGTMVMANLFAYRSTDPGLLKMIPDPVGPDNDEWLRMLAAECDLVVTAWGNHGGLFGRARNVKDLITKDMWCLGFTKSGEPKHPLYLRKDTPLVRFTPPQCGEGNDG
jgi:hypothetical protein